MTASMEWEFRKLQAERDEAYTEADKLQEQLDRAVEEVLFFREITGELVKLTGAIIRGHAVVDRARTLALLDKLKRYTALPFDPQEERDES